MGAKYDDNSQCSDAFYETPYALLDSISPLYRESFSSALAAKLMDLSNQREKEDMEVVDWCMYRGLSLPWMKHRGTLVYTETPSELRNAVS